MIVQKSLCSRFMIHKPILVNRYIYFIVFAIIQLLSVSKLQAHVFIADDHEVLSEQTLQQLQLEEPYASYIEVEDNTFSLSALKKWIIWFLSKLFGNKASFHFAEVLPYIIVIVTLVLIVMKIVGLSFSDLRKPKLKTIKNADGFIGDDVIGKVNFDNLILAAISDFDYRLAIRYSYLQLLQKLDEVELIVWEKQKSNFEYLLQLKSKPFYNQFTYATRTFEDAWYGEMPWTNDEYKSKYDSLKVEITAISAQIHSK
ncbi:hypothetical protein [Saccharicrinis aurantiacus]|uniref:hypothetical protein n=1 Tax=Saccharicrinis aurantiacus TaxID=1849719 RepID=UPI0011151EFF|nr:hypothetical protein [Saccharicrinis aurantiacus]